MGDQADGSWGMSNGHLEPWDFGHPGWVNERFSAHITAPVKDQLTAEVVAWTPGTNGTLTAQAYQMMLPDRPTPAELTAFLDSVKDKVKGRIVLAGKSVFVPVDFEPPAKRRSDAQVRAQYDPNNPDGGRGGRGDGRGDQPAPPISNNELNRRIDEFLVANGAALRINDAGRAHGQIIAFNNRTFDITKAVPTVVMRNEDYGRIARILADGTPVELEFAIVNKVYPEGRTSYNAVAEIPGSDKKDEVVMLGGHLDSWQSATGATDNAIGCAVMMEGGAPAQDAGRSAAPHDSRRAVERRRAGDSRVAGLRQGALRLVRESEAGVRQARRLSEHRFRHGPRARRRGVRSAVGGRDSPQTLAPFQDLGVAGASATRSRTVRGTDSTAFNNAGLPGIGFGQDPIEYNSHTHHTSLDNYERVVESDVKSSAIVIAATLYQLAMRDEMVPRFAPGDMPAPVSRQPSVVRRQSQSSVASPQSSVSVVSDEGLVTVTAD
jgi:cytochrome c1